MQTALAVMPFPICATLVCIAAVVHTQGGGDGVAIESPADESYVSGTVELRARVTASAKVVRVTFFADGRTACVLEVPPWRCEWDAGPGVHAHLIRVVAQLQDGARLVRTVRTKRAGFTEIVDVDVVQVTATVMDGDGRFVSGLPRDAFRVFENGEPQRITHFVSEDVPLELVLAIDMSGSMTDAMPSVKAAAKAFLGALEEKDRVTLLGFNNDILTLVRREGDSSLRMRAVDRLRPWGGTALYDAIIRAIDMLGRQQGRRVVVVFTDGDDQSSHVTLQDVERRVDASDATIYVIGQGRARESASLRAILDRLADVSGGRVLYPRDPAKLDGVFSQLVNELSHQYLLAYPPTNATRDETWREIDVQLTDSSYKVRARRGYRAVRQR